MKIILSMFLFTFFINSFAEDSNKNLSNIEKQIHWTDSNYIIKTITNNDVIKEDEGGLANSNEYVTRAEFAKLVNTSGWR